MEKDTELVNDKEKDKKSLEKLFSEMGFEEENNTNKNDEIKELGEKKMNFQKMVMLFKVLSSMNIKKVDSLPIKILDNLYIGSFGAAQNKEALVNEKITHIVNAACLVKNFYPEDFTYFRIENLLDSPEADIKQYFSQTTPFIKKAISEGGSVLVHCHAGISRSSTIIIAYMIEEKNYTFEDALKFCQEKRSKVNPNNGFKKQLMELEEELKNIKKNDLKEKEV